MNESEKEFLTELHALLKKHKANITWGCSSCSDLYGVYDEHMLVFVGIGEGIRVSGGGMLDASELKELLPELQ